MYTQIIVHAQFSSLSHSSIAFRLAWYWQKRVLHIKKLVVLTTEWLPWLQSSCGYESFTLVLETKWIRQPEKQVPNV